MQINAENAFKLRGIAQGDVSVAQFTQVYIAFICSFCFLYNRIFHFQDDAKSFTAEQILTLNCIPGQISRDSTFVNQAMRMQYRNSISKLSNRSVKGTCENTRRCKDVQKIYGAKPALSPEKVSAIRHYYNQRIHKHAVESSDFNKRFGDIYFKKLLSQAINNIAKRETNFAKDSTNLLDIPK